MARKKSVQDAVVRYNADMRALTAEVRNAARAQIAAVGEVERAVRSQGEGWRGLSIALQGVHSAIQIGSSLWNSLTRSLDATIGAASRQRTIIQQTGRALTAVGVDFASVRQEMLDFGAAQQQVTRYGDTDTYQMLQALAVAAGDLGLSWEQLRAGTSLTADVMEATGRSADESARLVARAYAGVTEGFSRFLPGARDALEEINDLGDAGERSAALVSLLEGSFGGAAKEIDEFDQKAANLSNTWGDLMESLGDSIRRALIDSGLLTTIQDNLEDWIDWADTHSDEFAEFFTNAADAAKTFVDIAAAGLGTLRELAYWAGLAHEEQTATIEDLSAGFRDLQSLMSGLGYRPGMGADEFERLLRERQSQLGGMSANAALAQNFDLGGAQQEVQRALQQLAALRQQVTAGTVTPSGQELAALLGLAENVRGTGGVGGTGGYYGSGAGGTGGYFSGQTPDFGEGGAPTGVTPPAEEPPRPPPPNPITMPEMRYQVPEFQGVAIPGFHAGTAEVWQNEIEQQRLLDEAMQEAREERIRAEEEAADRIAEIRDRALQQERERAEQEQALYDLRVSAVGNVGRAAGETVASLIKAEKPLAVWRAAMMLAEVGWQALVLHNYAGAAQAAAYAGLYIAAQAIGGRLSAGGGSGGGGGAGAESAAYAAAAPRGLISQRQQEGEGQVVQNFYFGGENSPVLIDGSARRWAVEQGRKARQLRETPRGLL